MDKEGEKVKENTDLKLYQLIGGIGILMLFLSQGRENIIILAILAILAALALRIHEGCKSYIQGNKIP